MTGEKNSHGVLLFAIKAGLLQVKDPQKGPRCGAFAQDIFV